MRRDSERSQRQRLLDAAGDTFAEHGFHQATVRDICRRARANVAAIKYHFGGKAQLYHEVLSVAQRCSADDHAVDPIAPPARRLRQLIGARLLRVFDDRRPAWHSRVLSREMVDPTPALDQIVSEHIRPRCEQLQAVVRQLLGPHAGEEQVRLSALSIIGQCLFYYHARVVLQRLFPNHDHGATQIDRLADHITTFSLAALHARRTQLERQRTPGIRVTAMLREASSRPSRHATRTQR